MMPYLIAADMDGTLLDSQKRLSPHLFPLISTLKERNIFFAVASGRQYQNLYAQFETIAQDIFFLAENGAGIYQGKTCLFQDVMPADDFVIPIQTIRSLPKTYAVLCTHDGAFIEDTQDSVFVKNAHMYYEKLTVVPDLLTLLHTQPAFKIAVFHEHDAETACFPPLKACTSKFSVVLSGADWVDFMNPTTNKGTGLQYLIKHLGLTVQQTIAFGDYLNDYELLTTAGCCYVMENGHASLKKIADHIAPSNDEDGVVCAIRAHFHIQA